MTQEATASLTVALQNLPVRKNNLEAWNEAERAESHNPKMLAALRLYAAGVNATDAAKAVGYADHTQVSRKARGYGFTPADRTQLGQEFRRIAELGINEWRRRLEEAPEDIPTSLLQVGVGIATDKIAKAEGWERPQEQTGDKLAKFVTALAQGHIKRVSLDIDTEPDAIDVTPSRLAKRPTEETT